MSDSGAPDREWVLYEAATHLDGEMDSSRFRMARETTTQAANSSCLTFAGADVPQRVLASVGEETRSVR